MENRSVNIFLNISFCVPQKNIYEFKNDKWNKGKQMMTDFFWELSL